MKALSLAQASRCELAAHAKCRCRCHGLLHGAKRAGGPNDTEVHPFSPTPEEWDRTFFELLPEDDPHHVRSKAEILKRRKLARQAARDKAVGQLTLFQVFEREFAAEEAKSDVY